MARGSPEAARQRPNQIPNSLQSIGTATGNIRALDCGASLAAIIEALYCTPMPKADQQPSTAGLTDDEDKLTMAQKLLHLARRYLNRKDTVHASIALARAEEIVTSVAVKQAEDDLSN